MRGDSESAGSAAADRGVPAPTIFYSRIVRRPVLGRSWITPGQLARHLDALLEAGFTFLSLDEAEAVVAGTAAPGVRSVLLTFDDASESLVDLAWPVLAERGTPAVVFVATGRVGRRAAGGRGWRPGRLQLGWSELAHLLACGSSVQSRGHAGFDLTAISAERAFGDLVRSRRELEHRLGVGGTAIAYPAGRWGPALAELAARAGFRLGFTRTAPAPGATPLVLPRRACSFRDRPAALPARLQSWGASAGFVAAVSSRGVADGVVVDTGDDARRRRR